MSYSNEFVKLDKKLHNRDSFDCGEEELNLFIKTKASKHMEAGISLTMVLPSIDKIDSRYSICSFFSVAPSCIDYKNLPEKRAKKLPKYSIPVFLIGQLAVNNTYKGQGLGKITLIKSLEYLWNVNSQMRAYAVIVDCLNKNAEEFYLKYGFEVLYEHNGKSRMFLPMETIEKLFT